MNDKPLQVYFRTLDKSGVIEAVKGTNRPAWFSHEACFNNLINTMNPDLVDLNVIIDKPAVEKAPDVNYRVELINSDERLKSLLKEYENNQVTYTDRNEAGEEIVKREEPPDNEKAAGQLLYEIIESDNLGSDKMVYIVEDDYLHLSHWAETIIGFYQTHNGPHYISLYDHADKYTQRYDGLQSQIIVSPNAHWRTIPSTCGTWAAPAIALKEDYDIHHDRLGDHNKWMKLAEKNRAVLSCMPGRATHCMENYLSPCVDWKAVCES